jgi:O-antigen ligase
VGVGLSFLQRINPAWFLAGAAFFLPIKPAPVNLLLALSTLFALLNSECRRSMASFFSRSELIPLWLLLGFFAITYFYPSNDRTSYLEFISKYGRLALIPVLASVLMSQANRHIIGQGFLSGMAIVLAMSYAIWFGIDPVYFGAKATDMYAIPSNPTVFKSHITHNFFLVVAIYLWLLCFFRTEKLALKGVYAALTLLGLVNLFGMIDGRTGWLVFMVIPLYFGYQKLGFKGFLLAGFVFAAMLVAAYFLVDNIHDRFSTTWLEIQQVLRDKPQQGTSIGERVIYLTSSWSAFLQAPFFGYGLGGVQGAVQPFTSAAGWPTFYNPHNQFLMLMLQGGLLALVFYIWFFGLAVFKSATSVWSSTFVLPLLMIYFVGNLLNSFHFDFAESVAFVILYAVLLGATAWD